MMNNRKPATRRIPKGAYTSTELLAKLYERTGRHVSIAWLERRYTPSNGERWSYGDLLRICAWIREER